MSEGIFEVGSIWVWANILTFQVDGLKFPAPVRSRSNDLSCLRNTYTGYLETLICCFRSLDSNPCPFSSLIFLPEPESLHLVIPRLLSRSVLRSKPESCS